MKEVRWYYKITVVALSTMMVVALLLGVVGKVTTTVSAADIPPNWWLDSNLHNGLWYEDVNNPIYVDSYRVSFMKIYSIGGTMRVMELSTYPRAYKDTSPHVYTVDTPFVVTESDVNRLYTAAQAQAGLYQYRPEVQDGTLVFVDAHKLVFLVHETAVHYAGDPLPGVFPLWIESESLPTPSWVDQKNTVFPMVFQAIKGQLFSTNLLQGYYRQDTDVNWALVPAQLFTEYQNAFSGTDTNVKVTKITKNKDRTIIRILYERIVIP